MRVPTGGRAACVVGCCSTAGASPSWHPDPVPVLRVLAAALVRAVLLVAVYAVFLLVLDRTDGGDALGAGLLYFVVVMAIGFAWAVWDGSRGPYPAAAAVWVLAGIGTTVGIALTAVLLEPDASGSFGEELGDGFVFLTLLVVLPALAGAALGVLIRRSRTA